MLVLLVRLLLLLFPTTMAAIHAPTSIDQAKPLVNNTLATAMHANHCAFNISLSDMSLGSLAFQRDMDLDIPLIADIP